MNGPYSIGGNVWPGLSKLIEEAGEVQQVCGKIIGSGGNPEHFDGTNLRARLESELADLLAAVAYVVERNDLDVVAIDQRSRAKIAVFAQWHTQQEKAQ